MIAVYQAKIKAVVQEYSKGLVSHIVCPLCSPFGYKVAIQRSSKLTANLSLLQHFYLRRGVKNAESSFLYLSVTRRRTNMNLTDQISPATRQIISAFHDACARKVKRTRRGECLHT
ncbi:hypothetical protein D4R47_02595 [archaeon]|nr:MAG: hypothetical protein D4R47_02595 [archaeon]